LTLLDIILDFDPELAMFLCNGIPLMPKQTKPTPVYGPKPYGPHLQPVFLTAPLRVYGPADSDTRGQMSTEYRRHIIIYQWFNLITGQLYVGSG
jgi:hypothetical protein